MIRRDRILLQIIQGEYVKLKGSIEASGGRSRLGMSERGILLDLYLRIEKKCKSRCQGFF